MLLKANTACSVTIFSFHFFSEHYVRTLKSSYYFLWFHETWGH